MQQSAEMAGKDPTAIKALHEVEKRLTCAVCLQVFVQPKSLLCLHAFCKLCLDHLPRNNSYILDCPICRSPTQLGENGIAGLPNAFHFNDLLELKEQLTKLSNSKLISCDNCEQQATGFCRQCGIFFCKGCIAAHLRLKSTVFLDHQIVSLEEVISTASQLIPIKQQEEIKCPTHKKTMDIYCETCGVLMCYHCIISEHKDHKYDPITDDRVCEKHLQQIKELIRPTKEKIAALKQVFQALKKRSTEITDSKERAIKEVKERGQQLIARYTAAMEESVQQVTEDMEKGANEKLGFVSVHKDAAFTAIYLVQSCLDYVEGELRIGSKQQILASKTQMVRRMEDIIV